MADVLCGNGMVVTPNHLASQAGVRVLREGGNALEAVVASAAALSVTYPHMCGLGGDAFLTVYEPAARSVFCLEGCGRSAGNVASSQTLLPQRGGACAATSAGAVAVWELALHVSKTLGGRMPLERLFEDAAFYAEHGFPVSSSLAENLQTKAGELAAIPGFSEHFLPQGKMLCEGETLKFPALAATLKRLAKEGLGSFYHGTLAREIADALGKSGSPLVLADLEATTALRLEPLSLALPGVTLYNSPPPTQGVSSLMILGICAAYARQHGINFPAEEGFSFVHIIVEATKQAFLKRNAGLADPAHMPVPASDWLAADVLERCAAAINPAHAMPWGRGGEHGDTVWIGAVDASGLCVSSIQSIYHEFGSGVVLPSTGILWHNRVLGFAANPKHPNVLAPGKKPFHTLNPALAVFADGRVLLYGSMGGEGQPQTQAAVFSRYAVFGQSLERAIAAPRWLLGRTWGAASDDLKVEADMPPDVIAALRQAGHDVKIVPPRNSLMGHAGAIVRHAFGLMQGASDPRSNGAAVGW